MIAFILVEHIHFRLYSSYINLQVLLFAKNLFFLANTCISVLFAVEKPFFLCIMVKVTLTIC